MTLQQKKAKAFGETLKRWDSYKDMMNKLLMDGKITKEYHDEMLAKKAKQLDL